MTAMLQSPVSLVVVNSATGDWRLDVVNRTGSAQSVVITMPMHPDGDETARAWSTTSFGVTGTLTESGANAVELSGFTLDDGGIVRIAGRSTFAETAKRVTVLCAVDIGSKSFTDFVHFYPGMEPNPQIVKNDVDMPRRFFDQEVLNETVLDGFYNGRWTLSRMIDYMRDHATDVAFNPDGITIEIIGDQAVVNVGAAISSGLAENIPIAIDANTIGLAIDLNDNTLHPVTLGSQLTASQGLDPTLTALGGLSTVADSFPYFTGTDTAALASLSSYVRGILNSTNAAAFRQNIGLQLGVDAQAYDAELNAIAGLTSAADKVPYFTGTGTAATADFTAAGRALVDDADAAAQRTTLGLGTAATTASTDYATSGHNHSGVYQPADSELTALAGLTSASDKLPYFTGSGTAALADFTAAARSLMDDADAATMRTTLGLAIGTNVQAYDAELAALAGLTSASDKLPYFTGSGTAALADFTTAGRALVDDASAAAQCTTLGLGTGNSPQFTGIELGHATDTTIARVSAGRVSVEGNPIVLEQQAVNPQTGTSYTLVAGDCGLLVTLSNANPITLTLPQDSDATIPIGTYVDLMQLGAGQVTVQAGTGATLRTSGLTAKARAQYSRMAVQKISANTWSLMGDLAAS